MLLKQVFTPGGQPSITYVSREHLGLEKRVSEALVRGYSINVVTGPTKSGKTVLCNHVLSQAGTSVTIEGGQVRSEEDFWKQIAHALDVGTSRTRRENSISIDSSSQNMGASALGINASIDGNQGHSRSSERSINYDVIPQRAALDDMLDKNISLLVDDFHYIDKATQRNIFRLLKVQCLRDCQ